MITRTVKRIVLAGVLFAAIVVLSTNRADATWRYGYAGYGYYTVPATPVYGYTVYRPLFRPLLPRYTYRPYAPYVYRVYSRLGLVLAVLSPGDTQQRNIIFHWPRSTRLPGPGFGMGRTGGQSRG